ncbi:MAG: acetate--CoA ligase family protein [Actinomycetota bacterium]
MGQVPEGERTALECMLEARSVAIVGATLREGSFGEQMMLQLTRGGFDGEVFPVNPKYEEILGFPCYPTIADVGRPVDLAILGVPNAALEEQLVAAAVAGARSAVIFASGFEEPRDGAPPLTERLAAIARDAGMAVCGGNGMGFVHVEVGLRACGFYEPPDLVPGNVTIISQSGSVFSAMLHNDRRLLFNLVVSIGQSLVTTAADYLHYALGRESTRAVGMFLETVRDVAGFRAGLDLAAKRDIPVVILKVGREPLSAELAAVHSGALAGEDGAYQALFETHGVLRVDTLDEMADTLELLVAGRRAGPGALASIHDSGGERAMFIDAASAAAVEFAEISDDTVARLAAVLEPGLPPVNPLDAWGTGNASGEIYLECSRALLTDPETAAFAFVVDLTAEESRQMGYVDVATQLYPEARKPVALLGNLASAVDRADANELRDAGIPVLEGTATGLAAFRHLFEYRDYRARHPVEAASLVAPWVRDRWRRRLSSGERIDEVEGLALLADYGVPVVGAARAASEEEVLGAAERLGWPVALKTAATGIQHKSDADGVQLQVADRARLEAAYADLAERLGPEVIVERMAPAGVELAFGIVRDQQFGPLVLVAAGGVLVEVLNDRRLAFPPLDEARARGMIDRLAVRPLLDGVRGQPPPDVDAVARALAALSSLATDLGDLLDALDVNPIIAGPDGCVAVDALVVLRPSS